MVAFWPFLFPSLLLKLSTRVLEDWTHIFLVVVSENHKCLRTVSKTLRKKSTLAELSRKSSRYPFYNFDLLTIVVHYPFSSHHAIQILDGPWTNSFAVCCCYNVCHYEQFTEVCYKWWSEQDKNIPFLSWVLWLKNLSVSKLSRPF